MAEVPVDRLSDREALGVATREQGRGPGHPVDRQQDPLAGYEMMTLDVARLDTTTDDDRAGRDQPEAGVDRDTQCRWVVRRNAGPRSAVHKESDRTWQTGAHGFGAGEDDDHDQGFRLFIVEAKHPQTRHRRVSS